MAKIKKFLILILFVVLLFPVNSKGSKTDFMVYLRMDKHYFYPNEEITLKIQIKNITLEQKSFDIYDSSEKCSDYTTFQPIVYDTKGNEAETIVPYRLENKKINDISQNFQKRRIILAPNEIFIHSINLNDIYIIQSKEEYRVKGFFFPDFNENFTIPSENELKFKVFKENAQIIRSGIIARASRKSPDHKLSPSEIVLLMLEAEKNREWEKYLKYLDIERYINSYSNFTRQYNLADDDEKLKIEKKFINFITRERDDYLIDYKISTEEIEKNNKISYVQVIITRHNVRKNFIYNYQYTLEKKDTIWLIINLDTSVIKQ